MELCKFSEGLLNQGGDTTMELWKGEMPVPDGMESALYHFLVRYYYIPESPYNFAVLDGRRLRGFLLAAPAAMPERHDSAREWILPHLTNDAQKAFFKEYWDYVNSNSDAERRAALPGEVLLLLFGSLQRGCGRIMMEAFESECRKTASAPICSGRMKPAISNITARTGLPQSRTFPAPQQSRENTSKPSCSGKRFEENAENIHFRKRAGDVP